MAKNNVSIKVPALALNISGEYSRYKKPTGLENLILTAIGTPALNSDTWGEFLQRLAIPETMAPLFQQVVDNLYQNGVIDTSVFDTQYYIDKIKFTETGRNLFEQGRIKQDPKEFHETVYYLPYAKYSDPNYRFSIETSNSDGFDHARFENIDYDSDALNSFIKANKAHMKADKEDEILSIVVDSDVEILPVSKSLKLLFDEASGDFSFEADLDPNFIKGYFSADEILQACADLKKMPSGITAKSLSEIPENWNSYKFQLPNEFTFAGKLKVFNPSACEVKNAYAVDSLNYSFVDILTSTVGRGYYFIKKAVSVAGLDGESEICLLVSRPLSAEEIATILESVITKQNLSELKVLLELLDFAGISKDKTYSAKRIKEHLACSEDIQASIAALKKSKADWSSKLGNIVEEAYCDSGLECEEIISLLKDNNLKAGCEKLISKFSSEDKSINMNLADNLFQICTNKGVVIISLGIREEMIAHILNGEQGAFKSSEFTALNTLAQSLARLRKNFGATSPTEYNLESFDESLTDSVNKDYALANKSMNTIKQMIADSAKFQVITNYLNLFQNLTEIYNEEIPLERLNGFQFGFAIRRRTEILLRSAMNTSDQLADLVTSAAKQKLITDEEESVLTKIRSYGNKCAHTKSVPPIDAKEKQHWVKVIENLEKKLMKGGKK